MLQCGTANRTDLDALTPAASSIKSPKEPEGRSLSEVRASAWSRL